MLFARVFDESIMLNNSLEKLIPQEKQEAVRSVIKYSCEQAEECKKLFKAEFEVKTISTFFHLNRI